MSEPKLLTLTVRRVPLTRSRVNWINHCFRRLMRRMLMRNVRSWIRNIEFKDLDDLGTCNLHIHVIIDSPYIDQARISREWCDITEGSRVIDIRAIKRQCSDSRGVLNYLGKNLIQYLGKDMEAFPTWKRQLVNEAFHDVRLIQASISSQYETQIRSYCPSCGSSHVACLEYDLYEQDHSFEPTNPLD